jgi:hypothetical protein
MRPVFTNLRSALLMAGGALAFLACTTAASAQNAAGTQSTHSATEVLETASYQTEDASFAQPYIDIDEWRDSPVRHRYVHGGFKGTDTRFSYYFPPIDQYDGRFFQHVTPVPQSENLAQLMPPGEYNKIGFSIDSGAYFVETNGGGAIDLTRGANALADPTITAYRANAAAAQFSRHVAQQIYAPDQRPYGYIYGGSGGGFRTIGSVENTQGIWDGAVPYVIGSTMAIPNMFTVRMQALRVLRDKFPQIVDAMEPGGSGDPYAGLTKFEASVLREIERMGFPMESWFGYRTMGLHGFAALYGGVKLADPTYFTDFWTKPGYLGHDHPEQFVRDRIQFSSTIAEPITAIEAHRLGLSADPFAQEERGGVDTAFKGTPEQANQIVGFRLAEMPPTTYMLGGELIVSTGAAKDERITLNTLLGDVVMLGVVNAQTVAKIAPGDEVTVDNSNFLAMETYHRHQVPGPDFPVWDQFRDAQGNPIYPQRPMLLGPLFVQSTSGSRMTGTVDEKIIIAASLWDREAMPWQADWYRKRVEAYHGDDAQDHVRLWYTDHALHGDEPTTEARSRVVSYVPVLQQALRDLAAWVEEDVDPPPSTRYRIEDGQVITPATAAERRGIQPTVQLTVNGGQRAEVAVGEAVHFEGKIAVPPGTGSIVSAQWDFVGEGTFPFSSEVPDGATEVTISATHSFEKPGTYFPALKGVSQRHGDKDTQYALIRELGRVRVVVE